VSVCVCVCQTGYEDLVLSRTACVCKIESGGDSQTVSRVYKKNPHTHKRTHKEVAITKKILKYTHITLLTHLFTHRHKSWSFTEFPNLSSERDTKVHTCLHRRHTDAVCY